MLISLNSFITEMDSATEKSISKTMTQTDIRTYSITKFQEKESTRVMPTITTNWYSSHFVQQWNAQYI